MRLIDAESPQNRIYVSDIVIEEMKKIPTVDIDRPTRSQFKRMAVQLGYEPVRHGRWIEKEKYTFGIMYDCSLCENRILDNGHHWNYCPNCGAKMDGAE